MFRHVVMFKWNDDVDADHVDAVGVALDTLVASIPQVVEYNHGPDVRLTDGNYDYVIVGEYASVDDFVAYRDHPDHQAFVQRFIAGRIAARAAVQYETS